MDQCNGNRAATAQPLTLNPAIGYTSEQRPPRSASGIAFQMLALSARGLSTGAAKRGDDPKKHVRSIAYAATCTKPWSRSHRDSQQVAVGSRGCRLIMRLIL
jgi:hypothetical protein